MARPLRIQFEGAWYHVMNRGANHQDIFFDDKDRFLFLNIVEELTETYGIEVHVYCLMGNHYHMILHTPRGNLSEAMRHLNSKYTQCINARYKKDGALFRGRYKAIVISADDYLLNVSRYIHLNPLNAKIIKYLSHYKWSSYRYYLGGNKTPPWLTMREIKKRFGENEFTSRYKNYVEEGNDAVIEEFYRTSTHQPALGGESFLEFIFAQAKAHSLSAEIVGADKIIMPPSIDEIINMVAIYFKVEIQVIKQGLRRKVKNPPRLVAIYLCRKIGGYRLSEIASIMADVSYSTISNSNRNTEKDMNLMKVVNLLSTKLKTNAKRLSDQ